MTMFLFKKHRHFDHFRFYYVEKPTFFHVRFAYYYQSIKKMYSIQLNSRKLVLFIHIVIMKKHVNRECWIEIYADQHYLDLYSLYNSMEWNERTFNPMILD